MDRPKPLTPDRRIPTWIAFLLGMAGVLVTVAGIYELLRDPVKPVEPPLNPASAVAQPGPVLHSERSAERAEIRRLSADGEARLKEIADLHARGKARCMDGVWIVKDGNEIRSAGRCQQR